MTISKKQSNLMDTYLKFSGGYRLANLKKSNMAGLEYPGFDADLSFDGVIIGSVKDGGDGGPLWYNVDDPEQEKDLLMHSFRVNLERGQKHCKGNHIWFFLNELEEVESAFKRAHTSKKKTFFVKADAERNASYGLPVVFHAVNSGYCDAAVTAINKTAANSFIFTPDVLARWPVLKISKSRK